MKMRADAGLQKRPLQQEHINRMIFSDQDVLQLTHILSSDCSAFWDKTEPLISSKPLQPKLPLPCYHVLTIMLPTSAAPPSWSRPTKNRPRASSHLPVQRIPKALSENPPRRDRRRV